MTQPKHHWPYGNHDDDGAIDGIRTNPSMLSRDEVEAALRPEPVEHAETVGASPKAIYPATALFVVGLILLVLDAIGAVAVDDAVYLTLLGTALPVFGIAWLGSPGTVMEREPRRRRRDVDPV